MLTRVFADNFRALVNFELRPGRLSLLLGDNGSGKTSVLNVLGGLHDLIALGSSSTDLFWQTRTKWDTRDAQRFELDFAENGGTYHYALEIQHLKGALEKPLIRSESVRFNDELLYQFLDGEVHLFYDDQSEGPVFPFRSDQTFLASLDSARAHRLSRLAGFRDLVAGLSIFQPNPFAMELVSSRDQSFLKRDGTNFAAFFESLNSERPEVRGELEGRLGAALPGFRNLLFRRIGEAKLLLAVFGDEKHKSELTLLDLSEGQRVLAILYAAVAGLVRHGAVLCFDEPDNFVSLPEIQPWLQVLRDALEEHGGQAIIISHHPEVMDYLSLDSVWRFERPSGPVIARPWDADEAPDLKLSDIIAHGE
jgi:ABC-type lipoprotein export system ATPase subunit